MRRTPLSEDELRSLAETRINLFLSTHDQTQDMPPYIAIIHDRIAPFSFSAGVTVFDGVKSVTDRSVSTISALWNIGRAAAREMYNDNRQEINEVQLLATIIVGTIEGIGYMWFESPARDEILEVVIAEPGEDVVTRKHSFKGFARYIEYGFNLERNALEIKEFAKWN